MELQTKFCEYFGLLVAITSFLSTSFCQIKEWKIHQSTEDSKAGAKIGIKMDDYPFMG